MKKRRHYWIIGLVLWLVSGCSTGIPLPKEVSGPSTVDETEIGQLVAELSHELLQEGIDTIAIVDFTNSLGQSSDFERDMTEKVFLAMTGFSGKFWVLSGDYLKKMLASQESDSAVWHVMGVKAVVYGVVQSNSKDVTLSLEAVDTETERTIRAVSRECRLIDRPETTMYMVETGENAEEIPEARPRQLDIAHEYESLPTFPWPPPEASAAAKVPSHYLTGSSLSPVRLDAVSQSLETALDRTGYTERSYYAVPGGFALVTRLEQFHPDGSSKQPPDRWSVEVIPPKSFSLASYLKALFTAQEGHFRIITFIVTSSPFRQSSDDDISREDAMEWLSTGLRILPYSIGRIPYTERHYCVALIYEFEQATRNHEAQFKALSTLPGIEHLKQANIWDVLEK
ncbi:hypothetical protein CSA56_11340 [candidate division KSB3 bacterium]|uniref:FlgO domain-containing protein n=1 Tax=candidate division KSB3 bacterium TaxID=2044937 RepID=A0A2G6KEY0_9BACT|nr:MAG: hypothetical protein CSA56_11340 [candidate division KSB3 bacterium]